MKKLGNTEGELKKSVAYKKRVFDKILNHTKKLKNPFFYVFS